MDKNGHFSIQEEALGDLLRCGRCLIRYLQVVGQLVQYFIPNARVRIPSRRESFHKLPGYFGALLSTWQFVALR